MDHPTRITDLGGNGLVTREVLLPDGSTAGIACTPARSADLSDAEVVAMVLQQWPNSE
ncbi:hypothetical protein ACH4MG_26930 [Streptomyces sp. NPDC017454]|uniref:hypothetical protein n=1 Tax=Streptomyces sp. NPDC017454 TaxID=3364997 RepID=UPI0037A3F03C